jgi:hypothetical protein
VDRHDAVEGLADAFGGGDGEKGRVLAEGEDLDPVGGDALGDEDLPHRLGALARQAEVGVGRADGVGMAGEQDALGRRLPLREREAGFAREAFGLGGEFGAAEVEADFGERRAEPGEVGAAVGEGVGVGVPAWSGRRGSGRAGCGDGRLAGGGAGGLAGRRRRDEGGRGRGRGAAARRADPARARRSGGVGAGDARRA